MIRFSEIIRSGQKRDVKRNADRGEAIRLRKTGILSKDGGAKGGTTNEVRAAYERLTELATRVESWVRKNETIDIPQIVTPLRSIIQKGLVGPLYTYLSFTGDVGSKVKVPLVAHFIDVTVLSLKVGIGMGYDDKRLLDLAMIAFLHDVGLYKIPEHILNKNGKLTEQELKVMQRHPELSADILSKVDERYTWLADMALQVYERADGSGYPKGLKGDEIHEYASLVGLVGIYAAMIKDRPYRERIEKNTAIRNIIASSRGAFPAKVVKAFLNQISFFPLNCYVKLNNRSVGRVITTNPSLPLKPTVEILYDSLGNRLAEERIVDLSEQTLLYVTGSVDEKEIG
jgi:HD-GYP domain-containing protein (c-di-GMP phosphodiesterase class II)